MAVRCFALNYCQQSVVVDLCCGAADDLWMSVCAREVVSPKTYGAEEVNQRDRSVTETGKQVR